MASPKVLIVEDEPVILTMVAAVLQDKGLGVVMATTADDGATLLETMADEVAVVFTDIETPGDLDGLRLASIISRRWPAKPVVLTSGRLCPSADSLPGGAIFVPKPYDIHAVTTLILHLAETTATADRKAEGD